MIVPAWPIVPHHVGRRVLRSDPYAARPRSDAAVKGKPYCSFQSLTKRQSGSTSRGSEKKKPRATTRFLDGRTSSFTKTHLNHSLDEQGDFGTSARMGI